MNNGPTNGNNDNFNVLQRALAPTQGAGMHQLLTTLLNAYPQTIRQMLGNMNPVVKPARNDSSDEGNLNKKKPGTHK